MTPAISQGIVGAQLALLLLTVIISFASRSRTVAVVAAWISTVMALAAITLAGAAAAPGAALGLKGSPGTWIIYGAISFVAAAITWGAVGIITTRLAAQHERRLASPETRAALGEELREVLRVEGIDLDERLNRAEQDREQFLYALEERHARQIAGLAQEYQHEAETILRNLVTHVSAEQIQPIVDEKMAEQREELSAELKALDVEVSGEALMQIREEAAELAAKLDAAEKRIAKLRDESPDKTIEEKVAERLAAIDETIDARVATASADVDARLETRMGELDGRISDVGSLLDAKVEQAGNPLAQRMTDTQDAVAAQLDAWLGVLDTRFAETEQILNTRIADQEHALENRVVDMEGAIEGRLAQHVTSVEQVLSDHDEQLQVALEQQGTAVSEHFAGERDRLITELGEHAAALQQSVAEELAVAETRARETVEATQVAWNQFAEELEQRFAQTREEALRAAADIAEEERVALKAHLEQITTGTSSDIAAKVEELGREAAWQKAQVERTVEETMAIVQQKARYAVDHADEIFADLSRIGDERVDLIRRQAEDSLVQSRDYVGQLQESLGIHLEQLRTSSGELAEEMNERLSAITSASQESASQLEQYARDLVAATSREIGTVSEHATQELQTRINDEFATTVQTTLEHQQRVWDSHLSEMAQRITQQVQGDLAGLADHARGAVTGELDQIIHQAREHARQAQEQSFMQVMADLAKQQTELAEQARGAGDQTRSMLEEALRGNRRQLDEAMASMGAHMREELVRFHDEGTRRVNSIIEGLRTKEKDLIRDEDRRLESARGELVRQHQSALENQVRSMVGGLTNNLGAGIPGLHDNNASQGANGNNFTADINRPPTPMNPGHGF